VYSLLLLSLITSAESMNANAQPSKIRGEVTPNSVDGALVFKVENRLAISSTVSAQALGRRSITRLDELMPWRYAAKAA